MIKTGKMENYNGVIQDYIVRKTCVPVTEDEIKNHKEGGGRVRPEAEYTAGTGPGIPVPVSRNRK